MPPSLRRRIARAMWISIHGIAIVCVLAWLLGAVVFLRWNDYLTGKDATLHSSALWVGQGMICVIASVRVAPPEDEIDWPPIGYSEPEFRASIIKPRWDTLVFAQPLDLMQSSRVAFWGFNYHDAMYYSAAVPTKTKDLYFFALVIPLYPFGIAGLLFLSWRLARYLRRRRVVVQRGFPVAPRSGA